MYDPDELDPKNVTFTTRQIGSVERGPVTMSVLSLIKIFIDAPFSSFVSVITKVPYKKITQDECEFTMKKLSNM